MAHPSDPTPGAATNTPTPASDSDFLLEAYTRLRQAVTDQTASPNNTLPSPSTLATCLAALPNPTSPSYLTPLGPSLTHTHLLTTILPALNHQSLSPSYYGFVTGGVLPIAEAADNLVTALDQNVQVHFPSSSSSPWTHSACTAVEDAALKMLVALLNLGENGMEWQGRTFTTGATAANILGLACAREAVVAKRLSSAAAAAGGSTTTVSVAEVGLLEACLAAGIRRIQVLTSMGHSSLAKAASVVGLGQASVREVGKGAVGEPWRLDLDAVERELERGEGEGVVSVIVVSAGEVNTGRFATSVLDMPKLRSLADRYGAWIHVDGGECLLLLLLRCDTDRDAAFGVFARALPKTDEFLSLHASAAGLELADSIAADGHKLLNVVRQS
jgi:glutamate/tyrosine decarboxylase-like PLP-dependent enzyme